MSVHLEIQVIAILVAITCTIPGIFLVLRKMAMISDAITHTILLGIVIGFLLVHDLTSPILIVAATLVGVITVWFTELLKNTKLVSEDAAIGIVFPLLFSIAIVIISKYTSTIHLDTDAVLLGELAFAPFNRFIMFGVDIGSKILYQILFVLIINLTLMILFFKEIKISIFDPVLASLMGFVPILIHYGLMTIVSVTVVVSFEAVGAILVVAFMVGPSLTAYLVTYDLKRLIVIAMLIAVINAIVGYQIASLLDVSIAGSMATMTGITFLVVFIFSKQNGLITVLIRRKRQRLEYAKLNLLVHLINHEGCSDYNNEAGIHTIREHLKWTDKKIRSILKKCLKSENVIIKNNIIFLTDKGRNECLEKYNDLFN